ncbi:cytochrome P450 [Mangrovihabitans endophyticus]|uniref:Cytochrome P450 hydroxylase n=1 Tax=Mangrovihabitans endophyticus TaxID=1751298 RepID=A0A8J3BW21_9ACTN|nr:cytochrome P450 [Mangrovihabitans endophyticus]GGK72646.1 cytochrome P450 hydroxylase [Mangrovihabitans endophyticus]
MKWVELARRLGRDDGAGDPDPHPTLAWLRATSPIFRLPGPGGADSGGHWLITSYDLARQCLNDPRLSFDPRNAAVPQNAPGHTPYVLAKDPPEHTVLRGMVKAAFSPGSVARLRERVAEVCARTVDTFADRERFDLFADYALPIPELVAYEFFGIAPEDRLPLGRATELSLVIALREQYAGGPATDEMHAYVARVADRTSPEADGLVGAALRAAGRGEATQETVLGLLYLLFATGQLSTAPFIAATLTRALQHRPIPSRPTGAQDWRPLINEVLRLDSPVQTSMPRFALQDLILGGERVAKGEAVFISVAAANRDPETFPGPDELRPDRRNQSHLAFGFGVHFCVGAPLARMEAEIAVDTLFRRLPAVRLAVPPDDLVFGWGPLLRCATAVPATATAAD